MLPQDSTKYSSHTTTYGKRKKKKTKQNRLCRKSMLYDLAHSTLLLFYLLKKRMAVQIGNVISRTRIFYDEFSTLFI